MPEYATITQVNGVIGAGGSPPVTLPIPAQATSALISIQQPQATRGRAPQGAFAIRDSAGNPVPWAKPPGGSGTGTLSHPIAGAYVIATETLATLRAAGRSLVVEFDGAGTFQPVYVSISMLAEATPAVSGGGVAVTDESTSIGTVSSLKFTGAGVTVTESGGVATVDIPGGGGGGGAVLTFSQVFSGPGLLPLPGVLAGTPEVMCVRLYGTFARADGVTWPFDFSTPWLVRDDGLFMLNDQMGYGTPLIAPGGLSHRLRFVVNDGVLGALMFHESNAWAGAGPNVWTLTINVAVLSRSPLADSGATMVPAVGPPETVRVVTLTAAQVAHDPALAVRTLQKLFIANPDGGSWDFTAPFNKNTREITFTPGDQGWDGRPAAVMVSVDGGDANRVFVGTLKGA